MPRLYKMPDTNPGIASSATANSQPAQVLPGTYTLATLPVAANMVGQLPGVLAWTSDQGICVWNGASWEAITIGGGPTKAETAAGVTPVNTALPPGQVDRYFTNTTPGTTDATAGFTAAIAQAQQAGGAPVTVNSLLAIASNVTI